MFLKWCDGCSWCDVVGDSWSYLSKISHWKLDVPKRISSITMADILEITECIYNSSFKTKFNRRYRMEKANDASPRLWSSTLLVKTFISKNWQKFLPTLILPSIFFFFFWLMNIFIPADIFCWRIHMIYLKLQFCIILQQIQLYIYYKFIIFGIQLIQRNNETRRNF